MTSQPASSCASDSRRRPSAVPPPPLGYAEPRRIPSGGRCHSAARSGTLCHCACAAGRCLPKRHLVSCADTAERHRRSGAGTTGLWVLLQPCCVGALQLAAVEHHTCNSSPTPIAMQDTAEGAAEHSATLAGQQLGDGDDGDAAAEDDNATLVGSGSATATEAEGGDGEGSGGDAVTAAEAAEAAEQGAALEAGPPDVPAAEAQARCASTLGDWCFGFLTQRPVPATPPPQGSKTCLWGDPDSPAQCNFVGELLLQRRGLLMRPTVGAEGAPRPVAWCCNPAPGLLQAQYDLLCTCASSASSLLLLACSQACVTTSRAGAAAPLAGLATTATHGSGCGREGWGRRADRGCAAAASAAACVAAARTHAGARTRFGLPRATAVAGPRACSAPAARSTAMAALSHMTSPQT